MPRRSPGCASGRQRHETRCRTGRLILAALALCAAGRAEAQPQPDLVSLVRRSGFIFEDTVKASEGDEPAVVVVNRVLEALPTAGDMKGQEVRLRSKDKTRAKPADVFRIDELGQPIPAGHEVGAKQPCFPGEAERKPR